VVQEPFFGGSTISPPNGAPFWNTQGIQLDFQGSKVDAKIGSQNEPDMYPKMEPEMTTETQLFFFLLSQNGVNMGTQN